MWSQTMPIAGPAWVARASKARMPPGVRAGRSASWIWCQPRLVRGGSRGGWAGAGGGRGAVEAVGPAGFPGIQIGLGEVQRLEAEPLERGLLGVPDARLDLALAIRIADPAGQGDHAIVGEDVAVEGSEGGG